MNLKRMFAITAVQAIVICNVHAQIIPEATTGNGLINATVYTPDKENGYYRGTRFDWAGVIASLDYEGHSFYGQWFEKYDPETHDAVTGPVEEFGPVGFNEAGTGEGFLKVGVGILERPDDKSYNSFKLYKIINPGTWKIKKSDAEVRFTHTVKDSNHGYAYMKQVVLVQGKPEMMINHTLTNKGSVPIITTVYNHNFPVIDRQPSGPGYSVTFPFKISGSGQGIDDVIALKDNRLIYLKEQTSKNRVYIGDLKGFGNTSDDYDIRIENSIAGAGIRATCNRPLSRLVFWSSPTTVCPEPYIDISIQPGETFTWQLKYEYYLVPEEQARSSAMDALMEKKVRFKKGPYYFDGTISRDVLENYLNRSVTMGYFLVPGTPEKYEFPYRHDDIRFIRNTGAKFIGRAIYRWSEESRLNDPGFLSYAKAMIDTVHSFDPEVVFQGCLFESVTADVNNVEIPDWVFRDFGLPVVQRNFIVDSIVKREGRQPARMGRGGCPIINNLETRLWYYFLAASYINIGVEALHLGQVGLIGADDKDLNYYSEFLQKIRGYARLHARRHLILLDGHVPSGGMIKDGISLLDMNSFPLRIKEIPSKPYDAKLEVGYSDALFKRSKGCISPSGWKCESLPYLVEFDNFGRAKTPSVADTTDIFVWGWDEISWFAQQSEEARNNWLWYAWNWIRKTDPSGHLQMPVTRMISCPNETLRSYFANTRSPSCPVGYSQEETIKAIWKKDKE